MSVRNIADAALVNDQSVRMLTLEPGAGNDPLIGSLSSVDVNSAGVYEPLSYVWSDPARTHSIICQGVEVHLTRSLYNALRRIRLPNVRRRIWADQICIDQDDLAERSQQVQFMNTIYRNASGVLVWLGNDDRGEAAAAFDLIRDLAETFQDDNKHEKFYKDHMENLHGRSGEEWGPLKTLTRLLWFTRTWIVQEIGTKASAILLWGAAEIDWHTVHVACENLTTYHHLRKKFDIKTAEIKYIFQRFVEPERTSRHANRFNFMYELHRARHLKVTDPRDRVFAFLGHYSIRHDSNEALRMLQADYTKTVEDIYIDAATRGLQDDSQPLVTLAAVQHMHLPTKVSLLEQNEIPDDSLPTWVPNWRTYQSHILSEPTSPHCASGSKRACLKVDSQTKVLDIAGIEIDTVTVCSVRLKEKTFHIGEDLESLNATLKKLWHDVCGNQGLINMEDRYVTGDSAAFAYMQTLSNGCVAIWWQQQSKIPENERRPYHEVATSEWLAHAAAFLSRAAEGNGLVHPKLEDIAMKTKHGPHNWSRAANGASTNRKLARTKKGLYVLGPDVMEEGDIICVLFGGKMPFCLRPWSDQYLLVGECYVHGIMTGNAIDMANAGDATYRGFEIR